MVLVLFLCAIIIILILGVIGIAISTIQIKILNFEISNIRNKKIDYKIDISAYLLKKVKWISFKLDKRKIKKMSKKMHLEEIDIKKIEKDLNLEDIKDIINIRPKISYLKLNMNIGLEDVILTSYLVPLICTILAIILPYITIETDRKNIYYKIMPVYDNRNVYHINLDATFQIKVIDILNAVYKMYRSRKIEADENLKSKFAWINIERLIYRRIIWYWNFYTI